MPEYSVDILLIEDNPHDADLAQRAFQQHELVRRMQVVRDGAEALDYLRGTGSYAKHNGSKLPRLILLDIKMPLVDGHYVLRQIRSDVNTRLIPVVILTSSREARDIYQSYQLGINGYVVKPVNFDEFTHAAHLIVQYWLGLNQAPLE